MHEEHKNLHELEALDQIPLIQPDLQRTISQANRMERINRQFSHVRNPQELQEENQRIRVFKNILKNTETNDFEINDLPMQLPMKRIFSNCSFNNDFNIEQGQVSFNEIIHQQQNVTMIRQDSFLKSEYSFKIEVPKFKSPVQNNSEIGFKHIDEKRISQVIQRTSKQKAEQQLTKKEEKKHLLYNLQMLLKQFFCNHDIDAKHTKLSDIEKNILKSILRKKFNQEIDINSIVETQLKTKLYLIMKESKQNYRPEERNKLIFKKALKMLREDQRNVLKKQKARRIKKEILDQKFLEFYFYETSVKEQIGLENFRPPTNNKNPTKAKTINNEYLTLVKKSQKFVQDIFKKLDNQILEDYKKEIEQKIDGLMERWQQQLEETEDSQTQLLTVFDICDYIEKKRECKLPWSIKDFQTSVDAFKEFFK